jgi:hypothetical protein
MGQQAIDIAPVKAGDQAFAKAINGLHGIRSGGYGGGLGEVGQA